MIPRFLLSALTITVVMTIFSCTEEVSYPVEPVITFVSFTKIQNNTGIDDKGLLKFSFTDGDGDIGLTDYDTMYPYDTASVYYYNCFIKYFEKQHGVFQEVSLPLSNNCRIPLTPPATKGEPLTGTVDIELYINNYFGTYDTIRFDVTIVDRALHLSNTISTPEIIIDKH